MAQYQETIPVDQYRPDQSLAMAYRCFQQLGWTVEYVFNNKLVGYTKKQWNAYADHIIVEIENNSLTITSKLPESTTWDIRKKNQKNVRAFVSQFQSMPSLPDESDLQVWQNEIESLQQKTEEAVVQEQKDAAEIESVMKLSSGSRMVTYSLIGINVVVFILMLANGVSIFEPLVADIIKWGGNFKPYTTGGEWWRLITNVFVHIGIIHLLFNMYALFSAGVYLEPLLGKARYLAAYLCTGIFASLTSLWWHSDPIVSAGASGAIFGLYGLFLALLTTQLIPDKIRSQLLKSIGIFVFYNLAYGMKSGVDNAAHVGGLVSGFVTGYLYFVSLRKPRFTPVAAVTLLVVVTSVCTYLYLSQSRDDSVAYGKKLEQLQKLETEALAPLQSKTISEGDFNWAMTHTAQVKWEEAKKIMDATSDYALPERLARQRRFLKEYVDLRIEQTNLIVLAINEHHDKDVESDLQKVTGKIDEKLKALKDVQ